MRISLLTCFLMTTACYPNPGLGDGRLALFHLDDNFTPMEHQAVVAGFHMWDSMGTHFVLADEYPGPMSDGPNILIERSSAEIPPTEAICWPGLNRITIYADYILSFHDPDHSLAIQNVVGHEIGHLMGLPHWGNLGDLMYKDVGPWSTFDGMDQFEFCVYYPNVKECQ